MKKTKIVLLLSCMAILFSSFGFLSGATDVDAADAFDFSNPNSENNKTVTAAELINIISGSAPSRLEKEHLESVSSFDLRYYDGISNSQISSAFDSGELTVTAKPISYTAKNGKSVTWIPTSAKLNGITEKLTLNDGVYTCVFSGVKNSGNAYITVKYACSLELSHATLNQLLNSAYNEGVANIEIYNDYSERLEAFEKQEKAYNDYLDALEDYKAAKDKYDKYVLLNHDCRE